MSEAYELARRNLEQFVSWYEANSSARNEATTRLQLIDRLFFECLGWSKNDVVLEEPHGGEYADYVFSLLRPVLIVEAKKESDYFELPAGHQRLEYSIPASRRDYANVKHAIDQAAGYCQSRGVPFGAISNGHQLIAFVATRSDGTPPLEGKALVFDSLGSMLSNFLDLWQALSKSGVEEKKLLYRLVGGTPALPPKLSATLTDYPGLKSRNVIQTDLQILSEIVIEDVIRSPDLEPQFLRECYCQSGALSQFALTSREILTARYSALFDSTHQGPSAVPATTKEGISPELLGMSVARRPILLIGDVGVGKTTFIRHLVNVDAPEVFKNALFFHLDLGSKGALAMDLRLHVIDEIQRQLLDAYGTDIMQRNFVRGVYDLQLKRFATGIYADLKSSSPETFLAKEIEYLESLMRDRESHLRHSLFHIARGRLKQVILFLDNADQRDEKTQELAFLIAQEFAENWQVVVFVALRPETFHRSRTIGALTGYHPKAFTISPETYAYSPNEIRKILSVLDEPARTVVLLMAHTGLRKGECMGLLWRDYDGRTLNVERALWNGFVHETKTDASKAPIPVTPQLRAALEAQRERMGEWAREGFPIFQSEVHSPMDIANLVKRVIAPALERCTVCRKSKDEHKPEAHLFSRDESLPRWFGWHSFRRGLATNLHAAGVDDKTIQAILRHSNVRITQDVYIKTVEESTVNAMNLIGEKMEHAPSMHRPDNKSVN
jgi:integrase